MHWSVYRVPSLLAGLACIVLSAALCWKHDRREGAIAAVLAAASFTFVEFSTEARGYAPVTACGLGALLFLRRFLQSRRAADALGFGLCSILGLLSQLIFLFFLAGAAAWSAWRLLRPPESRRGAGQRSPSRRVSTVGSIRSLLVLHLAPALAFVALYLVDVRKMEVGGGEPYSLSRLCAETVGYTLGLPVVPGLAIPAVVLAGAVLVLAVRSKRREGDDSWILDLLAIVIVPVIVLAVARPAVVAVRYFVVGLALFLLLPARLLAELSRRGRPGRTACGVLLALFLAGNGFHAAGFLRHGRGGYLEALRLMARETPGPRIAPGLDHDFRTGLVLKFYARYLKDREVTPFAQGGWPREGPDWIVLHRAENPRPSPPEVSDLQGNRYRLEGEFPFAGLSGFWWGVYKKTGTAVPPASAPEP
jgi:hypothetical protein